MFHEYAPAMPFFLPRGAVIYNRLVDYMRDLYVDYGYEEVITPQIFDKRLFETSGHLANYRENMYLPLTADALDERKPAAQKPSAIEHLELESLGLKPMNCPSHCLIFGQRRAATASCRGASPTSGACTATSAAASCTGSPACAASARTTRTSSARRSRWRRDRRVQSPACSRCYSAFDFKDIDVKLALRPEKRIGTRRAAGTLPRPRSSACCSSQARLREAARRRRLLRTEARVPRGRRARARAGSSARSRSTTPCPSASSSSTSAATAPRTAR